MTAIRIRPGKGEFIKRQHKNGTIEDICLHTYNIELSQSCFAQVPGELVQEVIQNNGSYSEETLRNYKKKDRDLRCMYCYARQSNGGKAPPSEITKETIKDFEEQIKPLPLEKRIIRIGKRTEAGHYFYRPILNDLLDLCEQYQAGIIMLTKALDFDKQIAEKFKKRKSVLSFSIGYDKLEPGWTSQGLTNKWRIEQAKKYLENKVNTTLTVVCDITQSINENEKKGSAVKLALNSIVPTRIIPIRLQSTKITEIITGKPRHQTYIRNPKQGQLLFKEAEKIIQEQVPYIPRGNNEIEPRFAHPDFLKLIENGLGICGRIGEIEYCDKCHIDPENPERIQFNKSELKKITYRKKSKARWKKRPKPKDPKQGELFY